jgi:Zn-dependent protease with chaperone function
VTEASPPRTERVNFYDELARRRRQGWLFQAICALVSAGVGFVLSAIVTPMVLLAAGGLLKLAARLGLAAPLARRGVTAIHGFAAHHMAMFEQLIDSLDDIHGLRDAGVLAAPLAHLAPVAVPALAAGVLVWWGLRSLFLRAGGEDLIARLGARPARLDDLEERQVANIFEEVALGSGAPAPRLFLIDTPIVNAAALGRSPGDAVVLVTRGLLDALDRDETEAVAARLVATIGAGDLRVAAGVSAVFRTFGFFLTLLDLALRWSAWTTLGRLALAAVTPRPGAEALARVGAGLEDGLQADTLPDFEKILEKAPAPLRGVAKVLLAPWLAPLLVSLLYKLVLFLWTAFFLGPPMALLWRNRCFWTDARAVKLARNPEAFARALEKIGAAETPPGAEALAYLFIGSPTAGRRAAADRRSMTLALPPPLAARIARLSAMGAGLRTRAGGGFDWSAAARRPGAALAVGCLTLLLGPLFAVLFLMIGYLTAIVMTIGLAAGLGMVVWLI